MSLSDFHYSAYPFHYQRRKTSQVMIGDLGLGSNFPIRVQSMTTTDTLDTEGSVKQIIRMVESGCELVRLTAPSIKEAANLEVIRKKLKQEGINTPLVADIHFTPNAAEMAARFVEKVRINPGNYVDRKKFEILEYSEMDYEEELDRIRQKFIPLIRVCKEYGTALRIGTNHGSLSDRIMSRYGDNPLGMVESALEFLRIAQGENYHQMVLSMKASNPLVMIQAYRLLVNRMDKEGMFYPLHIGVTEAGDGEDGRIKSAVGIGTLLEEGLGDTVRVSLTEDPEFEAPVAKTLINRYAHRSHDSVNFKISHTKAGLNPFEYKRFMGNSVGNLGSDQVPRVVADLSHLPEIVEFDLKLLGHIYDASLDKWHMTDMGADYIYTGKHWPEFMLPNGLILWVDFSVWREKGQPNYAIPVFYFDDNFQNVLPNQKHVVVLDTHQALDQRLIEPHEHRIYALKSNHVHKAVDMRQGFFALKSRSSNPIVIFLEYPEMDSEALTLNASADAGLLFSDGLGDGIWLKTAAQQARSNSIAFGILQACRCRISKTEYISCPSCGRTLFDLQETTAKIRQRTDHLKGIKIGIMGCIVNGPGEMADADFGYVGSGPGKITLYKGQEVMKKNIPEQSAVDELIALIKLHGKWNEPNFFS